MSSFCQVQPVVIRPWEHLSLASSLETSNQRGLLNWLHQIKVYYLTITFQNENQPCILQENVFFLPLKSVWKAVQMITFCTRCETILIGAAEWKLPMLLWLGLNWPTEWVTSAYSSQQKRESPFDTAVSVCLCYHHRNCVCVCGAVPDAWILWKTG